jgi:hypothetical protein
MSFLTPSGITAVYHNLEALESKLNLLGYIPFIGSISGKWGRGTLATAQAVTGFAIGCFYLFSFANPLASFYGSVAVVMIKHSILNTIRGSIEVSPFTPLIVLLPIDILFGRVFPYPA